MSEDPPPRAAYAAAAHIRELIDATEADSAQAALAWTVAVVDPIAKTVDLQGLHTGQAAAAAAASRVREHLEEFSDEEGGPVCIVVRPILPPEV